MVLVAVLESIACAGVLLCALNFAAARHLALCTEGEGGDASSWPPVTILKPLCGDEPLLEQALETCFRQAYREFQIVFGVQDAADPALTMVEALRRRFPGQDIKIVVDPTLHGPNRKLGNLINMLPFARHDVLVISDSDLHVPPNYLQRLVAALEKPGTGLVTALNFGRPPTREGWAQALAAAQINHTFLPGVLLARALGRQDCLGTTAMFRRETLERIGGFHPLVHVLAEDNVMGQRIRDLGLSIALADTVPTAIVPESDLDAVWHHEIRWARTIRELAPVSHFASMVQHPLFWSGLAMVLSGGAVWSIILFLAFWAARAACGRGIDTRLRSRLGLPVFATPIWLFPIRDMVSVVEIAASFFVDEVRWRGQTLAAGGVVIAPVSDVAK